MRTRSSSAVLHRGKCLTSKGGQNESSLVDLLAIVLALLVLLLGCPASQGLLQVGVAILRADHEADLSRGVSGNGSVGVLDGREDSLARLLKVGDDVEVKPLVLSFVTVSKCLQKRSTCAWSSPQLKKKTGLRRGLTTLGRNDTTLAESTAQQLKVWLLEESLGRALWVGGVGDDDIELVLLVLEELEAIADDGLGLGVVEANGHAGKVLLGETDDGLVDVAEYGLLDAVVLDNFPEDTTVATADDQNVLGVGVRVHGKVGDHLLVAVPVSLPSHQSVCAKTYENSSRSVHWITLSRTRTMP